MKCELSYIPERLQSIERKANETFYLGELLFRRCTAEELSNPFTKINLVDISINRQGPPNEPYCLEEDVLWNTNPAEGNSSQRFELQIAALRIFELNENNQYLKHIEGVQPDGRGGEFEISCDIRLAHKVEPCNYAHSAFEFFYEGKEMTFQNYKAGLGKDNKSHSTLRTKCKFEIARMLLKREVRLNWD